jgi:beta-N-acetylhexosaminidase
MPEVAELTQRLLAAFPPSVPPFIAVDQEGGRVQRLRAPVLQLPPMRALGQIDDPALTERAAFLLGSQLGALGFNFDFAPVLDVDSHPDSPVIGDRSFGADPARVARHGIAFARGLARAGLASCGKHFPGHGDTALDSHFALPRVSHARERLERVELAPFRAAQAELSAIMTAHIVLDAVDAERPATLSPQVITGLLRGELGFDGIIVSDDLEMKAIADHYGVADAACEAVAAGCDLLLICSKPELCLLAHEALVQRAERDPGFARALRAAHARTSAARAKVRIRAATRADAVLAALRAFDPAALEDAIAERHARATV